MPALQWILVAGILARMIVFIYLGLFNNDNHFEVIRYIVRSGALPHSDQLSQAYHPPLYYLLASLFLRLGGGEAKTVQLLSLILSIGMLLLAYGLIARLRWIADWIKPWCLALIAFHPQLVLYGLFISNDTLAIFIGMLIFAQCRRVLEQPNLLSTAVLGLWLGLGLLTKATFLAFIPPLALLIVMLNADRGRPLQVRLFYLLGFLLIAGMVGCYKYVENAIYLGRPFFNNLDLPWVDTQRPTFIGLRSIFDFNLLKLLRRPIISPATVHSYPLMLYGSFWYSFIPESTFRGNLTPCAILGSMIYLLALAPSLLMAAGALRVIRLTAGGYAKACRQPSRFRWMLFNGTALLILAMNLLMVVAVGHRADVWSVFQGRLLFPSYFGLIVLLNSGLQWAGHFRKGRWLSRVLLLLLVTLFVLYFASEIYLSIRYPGNPLGNSHMPYRINLKMM